MTNFEVYGRKLENIGVDFAMKNGMPVSCQGFFSCSDCDFYKKAGPCRILRLKWLQAEYIESDVDWSLVAKDTPVFVSNDKKSWKKRHFAMYKDGMIWVYANGRTSFTDDAMNLMPWQYARVAE